MLAPVRTRGATAYAVAVGCVALATLVRSLLAPVLEDHASFTFYFLAVSVAAWVGGLWPAVFAAVLSALAGDFFFTEPKHSLAISGPIELITMLLFVAVSIVIGVLSETSLRALERAKVAERAKDEFIATLAHELRSPLSVIYYANSLARASDAKEAHDNLELIDRQVRHLDVLIEDLLDASRVARGKIRLERKQVDAAAIVRGAVEKTMPVISKHRHKLAVQCAPEPIRLLADPVRMEQVLANLLTNAAKYTPDGGEITVTAEAVGNNAVFTVRDNGIGISEEMLPLIFDLFVQAEGASPKAQGGLGIGLALVKKLVEMHGGSVEAHSAGQGQGSQFVVSIPLRQPSRPRLFSLRRENAPAAVPIAAPR